MTETLKSTLNNPASSLEFDLHAALDEVLGGVGLTASDSGGKITFYGKDPIVPSRLRFGTMSGISLAAKAVAAAAIWRFRSAEEQDMSVSARHCGGLYPSSRANGRYRWRRHFWDRLLILINSWSEYTFIVCTVYRNALEMVTQMSSARRGIATEEMVQVAKDEDIDLGFLVRRVASGPIIGEGP